MSEPTQDAVAANIISLEASIQNLDVVNSRTQDVRKILLDKFLPEVLKLDMSVGPHTDPDQYASQTRFIEQTRQLLNDMDTSAKNHVSIKLKQKDLDAQQQSQVNIVELLSKIQINTQSWNQNDGSAVVQNASELADTLEKRGKELGCQVLDTELAVGDSKLPQPEKDDPTSDPAKEDKE